ncbi:ecto-ADP-ribosyltransferase 4 [Tenrec ecaudatus]|uniref:ecto-ADP-ribosyltransferase 4 n=1 Tax=Tenrec ecaudatus TaxID=94439 RepID=UPI003F591371
MRLQGLRNAFNTSEHRVLANRCKSLSSMMLTSVWSICLPRSLLPLLLLLLSLKRPTGSSQVEMKIDFDLAPEAFDDQYQGCSKQVMEALSQGDYFTKELEGQGIYSRAWQKAHLNWLNQDKALPQTMTTAHAVAILVYSLNNNVHSDFTKAMASAGRSPQYYEHSFYFKYLHYYLTSAIQLLRREVIMKNDSPCYEVYHRAKDANFKAPSGATVRFGQFLSASLLREEAQKPGNETVFTIITCLGAPVEDFTLKKEILVPPYELFEVINVSYHPRRNWLQLQSTGNLSTYNCQLLKGILDLN